MSVEYVWHRWFAWRPVKGTRGEIFWLKTVERKRYLARDPRNNFWLYRLIQKGE